MAAPARSTPRDAQVMAAILKDMGVMEYEPRLINVMLEFVYRYVSDVLDDAKVYSNHANKKNIDSDDVKLAIQCRMDQSFTSPPPRDLLMEIAKQKNAQVLPLIKPYTGLRLPPDRYCLSAPNYKMVSARSSKKHQSRIQIGMNQFTGGSLGNQRISIAPMSHSKVSSGGGNQSLTVVTKNMTIPTVNLVTKPSSQATSAMPKPAIRINTGGNMVSLTAKPRPSVIPPGSAATQPPIQIHPVTATTASLISNPLKRKLQDDDYDNI